MSLKRKFLLRFVFLFSGLLLVGSDSYAVQRFKIIMNPPKTYVSVGSDPITLTIKTHEKFNQYHWEISTNPKTSFPGMFEGKTTESAVSYVPPERIDQELLEVQIKLTVTDSQGKTASNQVKFYLHQESEHKSSDSDVKTLSDQTPEKTIPQLLQEGEGFFKQEWYLFQKKIPEGISTESIKPHKDSAFSRYAEVLEKDPNNRHARQKIQEIMEKYTALAEPYYDNWRLKGYKQADREQAKKLYSLSLSIARYRQNTLGDSVESQIREIQERLQELDSSGDVRVFVDVSNVKVYINDQYQGVAHPEQPGEYTPLPGQATIRVEAEGYPIGTKTETIHPKQRNDIIFKLRLRDIADLLKEADWLFEHQRYLTSKDKESKVAFDLYKEVLEIDPNNERALEKINEIMERYKALGDRNYKGKTRKHVKITKSNYQNYLIIALYRLNVLKDRSIREEIEEVQKRLENL